MKKKLSVFVILFAMCVFAFDSFPAFAALCDGYTRVDGNFSCSAVSYRYEDGSCEYTDDNYLFDFSNAPDDLKKFFVRNKCIYNGEERFYVFLVFMSETPFEIPYKVSYEYSTDTTKSGYKQNNNINSNDGISGGHITVNDKTLYYAYLDPLFLSSCSLNSEGEFTESHIFKFDGVFDFSSDSFVNVKNCMPRLGNVFFGGTDDAMSEDTPNFNQDDAEYIEDIGYLQNVSKGIYRINEADGVSANFKEVKYKFTWDSKTNTDFDVTTDSVYVAYYHQIVGYKQNLLGGKKENVTGSKVFIDRVKGANLELTAYQTDINSKCAEDLKKLEYTPLLQTISRNDANWLRIEVYHSDTNTWSYGGWVKIYEKGNGSDSDETTTWKPDPSGGDDDVQDTDGGYGDGEDTPGESGDGETEEEAEEDAKPVKPSSSSYSFSDFTSLLDSLTKGIGEFPELVGKVFSFLPSEFNLLLCGGLAVIIVLRVLGR